MPRKQSVSVCACCTPCSYLSILRCNHVPAPEVLPTHLYWVGTRQITENLFCGEFWDGISNAQMRILEKGPSPTKFIVPPPPPVPNSWPAWQSTPSQPNRAAGGKITFDLTARGVKAGASLVPFSARNGAGMSGPYYLAASPPTGSELSHYLEAKICDEQVAARLDIDVLPFQHGASAQTIGFTHTSTYDRQTNTYIYEKVNVRACPNTATLFQNAMWHIGGNITYSQAAEYAQAFASNNFDLQEATRDYFVCRFRLSLGDSQRLVQRLGGMPTGSDGWGKGSFETGFTVETRTIFSRGQWATVEWPDLWENFSQETIYCLVPRRNGDFRWPIVLPAPVSPATYSPEQTPAIRLAVLINEDAVVGTKNTVLATAHTEQVPFPGAGTPQIEVPYLGGIESTGSVGPIFSPSRSAHAVGSFSDVGIRGMGASFGGWTGTLKVFRDGVFVSQFANITPLGNFFGGFFASPIAGLQQATSEEGVYLLQFEPNDDSGKPPFALGSFVVDQTPPLVVIAQRNDMYVGDASESFQAFPKQRGAACSEPSDSFNSVYGSTYPYTGEEFAFFDPMPPDEGIYSWAAQGSVYDRAGNLCRHNPQLRLTVHAVPPDGKFGAHAQIELPFIGDDYVGVSVTGLDRATSEFRFGRITTPSRALLYANPVTQFVVRFDRPVRGLTRNHITLERWGEPDWSVPSTVPPSDITVTQRSPTEWLVSFDTKHRNCVWYAKVDPAGGQVRVIDQDGDNEDDEEQCRLAARSMWAVLPQRGVMEPIDCQPESMLVGGVSSITEEVEIDVNGRPDTIAAEGSSPGRGYRDITLSSSREMYLPSSAGEFTADKTRKSFIPNVPSSRFNGTGITGAHSYFGLPTTIYPSPPALVEPCAAPSVAQKHSSVICSTNEILNWTITREDYPGDEPAFLSFSSTYRGYDCQQNVWADDGNNAFLYAVRNVSVHRPLKTAFLHRLTIHIRGFWEKQTSVSVSNPFPPADGKGRRLGGLPDDWVGGVGNGPLRDWFYTPEQAGGNFMFNPNGWEQGGDFTNTSMENFSFIGFSLGPFQFSTEEEETLANGGTVTRPENSWTISFRAS